MTISLVKKLSRRCLLVVLTVLATGCASVKQMPSASAVAEESSNAVLAVPAAHQVVQEDSVLFTENLPSEKPADTNNLVSYISNSWNVSLAFAKEIVDIADKNAFEDFPKRNDILAIIAVESGFRPKASLRGSYGLMQIEKKSHIRKLAGRSIFSPSVNIEIGAQILNEYFKLLGKNIKATLLSYNAGIGNYKRGRFKYEYYLKYKKQLALLPKL